jgi:hypothetical protein
LFRHAEAGFGRPVLVRDGHEPRAAKLARRWRRRHGSRAINLARREEHRGQQPDENGQKSNSNHKRLRNKTLWRARWQSFFEEYGQWDGVFYIFFIPPGLLLITRREWRRSYLTRENERWVATKSKQP